MTRQVLDRRKTQRTKSDIPVPFVELSEKETPALLKNISTSGLACICKSRIPEMTVVEMTIQLPALPQEDAEYYPLNCKGAVVRCEPVSRGNSRRKWLVAIFFTEMDEANKQILEHYIDIRS